MWTLRDMGLTYQLRAQHVDAPVWRVYNLPGLQEVLAAMSTHAYSLGTDSYNTLVESCSRLGASYPEY